MTSTSLALALLVSLIGLLGALTVAVTPTTYAASPGLRAGGLPTLPTSPDGDPPGANDWSCRPAAARPEPVILVHGTFGDRKHLLERLSSTIKKAGFCVFSLDYGNRGTNDIKASAAELADFTERVLGATGASKVSMVGHSQGGMMPRYYIKYLGGAAVVDDLVGISPSNHGTALTSEGTNPFSELVGYACRACLQQGADSPFLRRLNQGDETPGDVSYTQIVTRYDEVVVPYTSGFLAAGPRTTNITLQDRCPFAIPDHVLNPTAGPTVAITLDALTHDGPARASYQPSCLP